jgi:phosphate transport system permease protein
MMEELGHLPAVAVDTRTREAPPQAATQPGGGGGGAGPAPGGGGDPGRPPGPAIQGTRLSDRILKQVLQVFAAVPLAALVAIVVILFDKAWPAIRYNGLGFFVHDQWLPGQFYGNGVVTKGVAHPPGASYGAWPLIVGTLASSAIAIVLAIPIAVGTALLVVEKLPRRLSSGVGFCLEVLAGVPSVVYGLWGALTLGPFLARDVSPLIANHVPDVPILSFFRGPTGSGEGLFTGSVILAIMILPIIAATTRDLLRQVPQLTVEGALALGMTDSESVRAVKIPWVRSGVIGASVLGLGRALGETMALAMVSGAVLGANVHNFYQTFGTIAATIVSQLDSSLTDSTGLAVRTLAELGLVLLAITLLANIAARMLVRRVSGTALPVGRGV